MKENKFNKINLKKTKFKDDLSVVKVYAQNGGGSNAANAGEKIKNWLAENNLI